ncbi:MAG: UPF0175 family protein [Planctomycetes bacterium]|nr:UPF0175 family protein [Planctomycetota bacterium]
MNDISIIISGEALAAVKIPRQRLQAELRKELAIQLYREGLVSGAAAARICRNGENKISLSARPAGCLPAIRC